VADKIIEANWAFVPSQRAMSMTEDFKKEEEEAKEDAVLKQVQTVAVQLEAFKRDVTKRQMEALSELDSTFHRGVSDKVDKMEDRFQGVEKRLEAIFDLMIQMQMGNTSSREHGVGIATAGLGFRPKPSKAELSTEEVHSSGGISQAVADIKGKETLIDNIFASY